MYSFESRDELAVYIAENIINTSEAAQILGCSHQNIEDLIRRGKLVPVKRLPKDKLFFKEDILARIK